MRFYSAFVLLALSLVLAGPAMAQDKKTERVYELIGKLQTAGKHQKAIQLLDKTFKTDVPVRARLLKAASLAATGKGADGFALLEAVRTTAGGLSGAVQNKLDEIGKTLPPQTLRVVSTPAGATVQLDGVQAGRTPADLKVTPGMHTVAIDLTNHRSHSTRIFVKATAGAEVTAQLEPTVGALVVAVDQDDLRFSVGGGSDRPAKRGDNSVTDVPAGAQVVRIVDKAGKELHQSVVTIRAGGTARVEFFHFGTVKTPFPDATIEVVEPKKSGDKKDDDEKDGAKKKTPQAAASLRLPAGKHTVIVRRPGRFPLKGTLDVTPGKSYSLTNDAPTLPDRKGLEIGMIVGLSLGLAMVTTATILELADVGKESGGDAAKFTLAGVGGGLFIASGAVLKWSRDSRLKPTPRDESFQIRVGAGLLKDGGMVVTSGRF